MSSADWVDKDFYQVLGVDKDADQAAIKKAYRKLAREHHPDARASSGSHDQQTEERFKEVAEAYDVLGDAEKRKEYDEMRAAFAGGFPGGFSGGSGFPGGYRTTYSTGGDGGFDISDLLGGLFGGGAGRGGRSQTRRAARGADLDAEVTISFTEAVEGTTISLRLSSEAACETCHGTGGKPGTTPHVCPTCDGSGMVVGSVGGAFSMNETCPTCHGRQLIYSEPCPTCRGSGRGRTSRTITARIPAGVKDGQRIRLKGKGAPGDNGGPAGDLMVTVHVGSHSVFGRRGDHLTLAVPVDFDEAVLGAEIKVPTLDGGPVTLRIPAGTPNGRVFRVRGRGAKRKDGSKGDLLVTVEVVVPAGLSEEARAAVEAYREATAGSDPRAGLLSEQRSG